MKFSKNLLFNLLAISSSLPIISVVSCSKFETKQQEEQVIGFDQQTTNSILEILSKWKRFYIIWSIKRIN